MGGAGGAGGGGDGSSSSGAQTGIGAGSGGVRATSTFGSFDGTAGTVKIRYRI